MSNPPVTGFLTSCASLGRLSTVARLHWFMGLMAVSSTAATISSSSRSHGAYDVPGSIPSTLHRAHVHYKSQAHMSRSLSWPVLSYCELVMSTWMPHGHRKRGMFNSSFRTGLLLLFLFCFLFQQMAAPFTQLLPPATEHALDPSHSLCPQSHTVTRLCSFDLKSV